MDLQNKTTPVTTGSGSNYIKFGGLKTKCNLACKLSQEQIDVLHAALPPRANQAKRMVDQVAKHPYSTTAQCNVAVLAVNLSDIAIKYNPYLRKVGYELKCQLPERLIKNRFNLLKIGLTNQR